MKLGLFLKGELMIEYPINADFYEEALQDAKEAFDETGIIHELKFYRD